MKRKLFLLILLLIVIASVLVGCGKVAEVTHITVTPPSKLSYEYGEELNLQGATITAHYSDSSKTTVSINNPGVKVSGFDATKLGEQTITVTYQGKTATFKIVVNRTVSNMKLIAPTKLSYDYNEALNLAGGKVVITYSDNSTVEITLSNSDVAVTGYDKSKHGEQTITVKYSGQTVGTFKVKVNAVEVSRTLIAPNKTDYYRNVNLDLFGGKIDITYSDGATKSIPLTDSKVTVTGYDKTQLGRQTITVAYEGKVVGKYSVIVRDTDTVVLVAPTKVQYDYNEMLDLTGGKIIITKDGVSTEVLLTDASVEVVGYDKTKHGVQTLEVFHNEEKVGEFNVTVNKIITGYDFVAPSKLIYNYNDELDLNGLEITIRYSDESTYSVNVATDTKITTDYNKTQHGNQTVTISYDGKAVGSYEVTVNKIIVDYDFQPPTKVEYDYDEELSLDGLKATIIYSDTTTKDIELSDPDLTIEGYNKKKHGEQIIKIKYKGEEIGEFTVTVNPILIRMELTAPTKTVYLYKQELDLTGGFITRYYSDETSDSLPLEASMITDYDREKIDEQNVKVTYEGETFSFTVTVNKGTVSSISVSTQPKTNYLYNEDLDLTGGKLKLVYDSTYTETIDLVPSMISGYNKTAIGTQTINVEYDGKSTTFVVTVDKGEIESITVSTLPKTEYLYNEVFNPTGGKITVVYNTTYTEVVDLESGMVSGYDSGRFETYPVTVTYGGKTAQFNVTVSKGTVVSITVSTLPKTNYIYKEPFDVTGGKLTVVYDTTYTEVIDLELSMTRGFNNEYIGTMPILVDYADKIAEYEVTVSKGTLESIAITTQPKTNYLYNEDLDLTGGKLTLVYDSTYTETIDLVPSMISGYNKTAIGTQTINVEYDGKSTTFVVTVDKGEIESITVSTLPKTEYLYNEVFNPTDGKITVVYNTTYTEIINLESGMVSGYDSGRFETYPVTVTYGGKTAQFNVTVSKGTLESIAITTQPKTNYLYNQDFDPTGGKLTLYYNSTYTETIDLESAIVVGYDKTKIGAQILNVEYGGKTAELNVTLSKGEIDSISVSTQPKTTYLYNEAFDPTGGKLEVVYDSGYSETIDLELSMVSGYDNTKIHTHNVTITYGGKSTTLEVNIIKGEVESIQVKDAPLYSKFSEGINISTIIVTYNSGYVEDLTVGMSDYNVIGYNPYVEGEQLVTIEYKGKITTFYTTVVMEIYEISVTKEPNKTVYNYGELDELDLTGGVILVTVTSFYQDVVSMTDDEVTYSGYNKFVEGTQTITVKFRGFEATFTITVTKTVESVSIKTMPSKLEYNYGEVSEIDLTGGVLTLHYVGGHTEDILMTSSEVEIDGDSYIDHMTEGKQTVTLNYQGKQTEFEVEVVKILEEIRLQAPSKLEYVVGDTLSLEGGAIILDYKGTYSEPIPLDNSDVELSESYDMNTPGNYTITVSYKGEVVDNFTIIVTTAE